MKSFAGRIRQAAAGLNMDGRTFGARALSIAAGIDNRKDQARLWGVLRDLRRAREIEVIRPGEYRYLGKSGGRKPQLKEVMWRLLGAMRAVTVEDLQALAGASEAYAREWLGMLARNGIVRELKNGKWQLVKEDAAMPEDEAKAERLRKIRADRKREALEALETAAQAIEQAKGILAEGESHENGSCHDL